MAFLSLQDFLKGRRSHLTRLIPPPLPSCPFSSAEARSGSLRPAALQEGGGAEREAETAGDEEGAGESQEEENCTLATV